MCVVHSVFNLHMYFKKHAEVLTLRGAVPRQAAPSPRGASGGEGGIIHHIRHICGAQAVCETTTSDMCAVHAPVAARAVR